MNASGGLSPASERLRAKFAAEWEQTSRPSFQQCLSEVNSAEHVRLLCALVEVDWQERSKRGEHPSIEEYIAQFPDHREALLVSHRQGTEDHSVLSTISLTSPSSAAVKTAVAQQLGRYELQKILGRGGFGMVWKALDPALHRTVAIKILRNDRGVDASQQAALLEEARKIAQLNHPGILKVYDALLEGDSVCVVSEWISGGTLADHRAELRGKPAEAAELIAQAAEALHYAHVCGIVHRDIKPQNILLDEQGKARIADFGLAVTEVEQLNEQRGVLGTLAYMSPEILKGDCQFADPRSDIYSLGAVLYELLTGRRPFVAQNSDQWIEQAIEREPRPPRSIDDRIPLELERICLKCLAKKVSDRYTTAHDLAEDLRSAIHAKPDRRWQMAAIGLVGIAAVVLFGNWFTNFAFPPAGTQRVEANQNAGSGSANHESTSSPQPEEPLQPEFSTFPPRDGEWTNGLRSMPPELFWIKDHSTSELQHDPIKHSLKVLCPSLGLLALGKTTPQQRLDIQARIAQPAWSGGVGFFFGYHDDEQRGPGRKRFQLVRVQQQIYKSMPHLAVYHGYVEMDEAGHVDYAPGGAITVNPLPIPERPAMLELSVDGTNVFARFAEVEAPGLELSDFSRQIDGKVRAATASDYQGEFGLYLDKTAATFSNLNLKLTTKSD